MCSVLFRKNGLLSPSPYPISTIPTLNSILLPFLRICRPHTSFCLLFALFLQGLDLWPQKGSLSILPSPLCWLACSLTPLSDLSAPSHSLDNNDAGHVPFYKDEQEKQKLDEIELKKWSTRRNHKNIP